MKLNMSTLFGDTGAQSTSKSITFTGTNYEIRISKNGYDLKPRKSKWYNILVKNGSFLDVIYLNLLP